MGFNNYIRDLRKEKDLSQANLAAILNVSTQTIKNAESGTTEKPNTKFLKALAEYKNEDEIKTYRDIIFNSYFYHFDYSQHPFIDLLTLYAAKIEFEGIPMDLPMHIDGFGENHCFVVSYKLKNPTYLLFLYDANYFLYNNITFDYNNSFASLIEKIVFNKEINRDSNKDVKRIDIVFDSSLDKEKQLYNSFKNYKTNVLNKVINLVLFNKKTKEIEDNVFI